LPRNTNAIYDLQLKNWKIKGNVVSLKYHSVRLSSNITSNFSHPVGILGLLTKLGEAAIAFFTSTVHPSAWETWASSRFSEDLVFDFLKYV
jgi:hypothetical protein